jgi:Fe-S-cluster containining protein
MEKIQVYIKQIPQAELLRLAGQQREEIDCGFLDIEDLQCAIYPVRPWVCEAYGQTEGMQCPKARGLVQFLPDFLLDANFMAEYESDIVGTSNHFDWRINNIVRR